jgi:hypothetical protein
LSLEISINSLINTIRIDTTNTKEFVLHLDVLSTKKSNEKQQEEGRGGKGGERVRTNMILSIEDFNIISKSIFIHCVQNEVLVNARNEVLLIEMN